MQTYQAARDRETETGAMMVAGNRGLLLLEGRKNSGDAIVRNTAARVGDPERVLVFLSIAIGFAVATVFGTIALFWSMGRSLTIAATILSVHRNVGLTYALIGTAAGHDFAIYVAVSQIPMFLSPILIHLIQVLRPGTDKSLDRSVASMPQA